MEELDNGWVDGGKKNTTKHLSVEWCHSYPKS